MGSAGSIATPAAPGARLRLLSYNIQVGIGTRHFGDYLLRGWQHVMPHRQQDVHLDRIANLIRGYDFVALQEADAGSFRTGHRDLIREIAARSGHPHWGHTVTRDLWPFSRHSLGYVSRHAPASVEEHVLPSTLPGRRALTIRLGETAGGLTLLLTHLSLGSGSRRRQLDYLSAKVPPDGPVIMLGDLNTGAAELKGHAGLSQSRLWLPHDSPATYPSWRPTRAINHALITPDVRIERIEAVQHPLSDHLPLAIDLHIPR